MTEPMLGRPEDCEDWYVAVAGYLEPLGLARPEETMSRRETLLAAHIVQAALADDLREQLDRSGVRWDSVTDICRRLDSMRPRGGGARMREFVRITVYD
ncbi:hypothetical protein N3K66_000549 [Trichothecium roseum]|uniref:Uncharacterized protein n=1 Tax=Trichothecium roseum TaxID=47278 RepID=A0ACC0VDW2_9HYPO|nr:hypothetical protein N3K66_000549 [Trichothecium roseum]